MSALTASARCKPEIDSSTNNYRRQVQNVTVLLVLARKNRNCGLLGLGDRDTGDGVKTEQWISSTMH